MDDFNLKIDHKEKKITINIDFLSKIFYNYIKSSHNLFWKLFYNVNSDCINFINKSLEKNAYINDEIIPYNILTRKKINFDKENKLNCMDILYINKETKICLKYLEESIIKYTVQYKKNDILQVFTNYQNIIEENVHDLLDKGGKHEEIDFENIIIVNKYKHKQTTIDINCKHYMWWLQWWFFWTYHIHNIWSLQKTNQNLIINKKYKQIINILYWFDQLICNYKKYKGEIEREIEKKSFINKKIIKSHEFDIKDIKESENYYINTTFRTTKQIEEKVKKLKYLYIKNVMFLNNYFSPYLLNYFYNSYQYIKTNINHINFWKYKDIENLLKKEFNDLNNYNFDINKEYINLRYKKDIIIQKEINQIKNIIPFYLFKQDIQDNLYIRLLLIIGFLHTQFYKNWESYKDIENNVYINNNLRQFKIDKKYNILKKLLIYSSYSKDKTNYDIYLKNIEIEKKEYYQTFWQDFQNNILWFDFQFIYYISILIKKNSTN